MADGPTVVVDIDIDAPPSDVWRLITDINLSARFQDEFLEGEWIDDQPGLGARFLGRNRMGDREWETTNYIAAYDPLRRFGWAVDDPELPGATWTFILEPRRSGTHLTYRRVVGPGPSGLAAIIDRHPDREEEFIERRDAVHREHMTAVLRGIKALAEEPQAASPESS
ncbi:MAG: SRPBCC family protein [Acidimicrobiia bacterium]